MTDFEEKVNLLYEQLERYLVWMQKTHKQYKLMREECEELQEQMEEIHKIIEISDENIKQAFTELETHLAKLRKEYD